MSDVDIALYLNEPSRQRRVAHYAALRQQLERAIGDGPVDLILLNDAPPLLAGRAIAGHLIYCASESQRVRLEAEMLSRYHDFAPVAEMYDRFLRGRIRAGLFGRRSSPMVDPQVISDRLAYVETTLQQLQQRRSLTVEDLRRDLDKRGATFYELQTCIEAMSDIANHIVAAGGLRKPKDRGESFLILAEAGILPPELAQELIKAIGMRNVLVHGYLDILLEWVHQTLQNDLLQIEAFARHVVAYLDALTAGG